METGERVSKTPNEEETEVPAKEGEGEPLNNQWTGHASAALPMWQANAELQPRWGADSESHVWQVGSDHEQHESHGGHQAAKRGPDGKA